MRPSTALPFLLLGLLLAVEMRSGWRGRRAALERDNGSFWVVHLGCLTALTLAFTLSRFRPFGLATRLDVTAVVYGATTFAAGLLLRVWAIRTLGRYFTRDVRVTPDQPVVTAGPFGWIRHPSYTGLMLETIGIAIALRSSLSVLVVLLVAIPAIVYRVRVEERALYDTLGEPYERYARSVRRFVPFVV